MYHNRMNLRHVFLKRKKGLFLHPFNFSNLVLSVKNDEFPSVGMVGGKQRIRNSNTKNDILGHIVPTKWPHVEANLSRASAIQVFWSLESKFANSG